MADLLTRLNKLKEIGDRQEAANLTRRMNQLKTMGEMGPAGGAENLAGTVSPFAESQFSPVLPKTDRLDQFMQQDLQKRQMEALAQRRNQAAIRQNVARTAPEYSVLWNEDFGEKSAYRPTENGRETKMNYFTGQYTESGFDDILYDIINGNETAKNRGINTAVRKYKDIPENALKVFNYIYATKGKNAAYEFLDTAAEKEYTGIEAAALGAMQGAGLSSVSGALGAGVGKITGDDAAWYGELQRDAASARKQHPALYNTGSAAGTLGLMMGAGRVLATIPAFAGMAPLAQTILSGAASLGGTAAVQGMGDAATGATSLGDYAKNVGVSALAGAAGGAASSAIGMAGTKVLQGLGLSGNMLARTVVAGLSGAGFSAAKQGVTQGSAYLSSPEDYQADAGEIAQDVLVGFAFSAVGYLTRNYTTDPGTAARMDQDDALMEKYFKGMGPEEAKQAYRSYARQYHPDVSQDPNAQSIMQEINAAWARYTAVHGASAAQKARTAQASGDAAAYDRAAADFAESVDGLRLIVTNGGVPAAEAAEAMQILDAVAAGMSGGMASASVSQVNAAGATQTGGNIETLAQAEDAPRGQEMVQEGGVTVRSSGISALAGHDSLAKTLASSIEQISDMQPVTALTGLEMNDRTKKPSEQLRSFFSTVGSVFRRGFGSVSFGEYGVGGTLNHRPINRAKLVSVTAAPEVVQNGRIISDVDNWKGRGYRSVVFAAPVTVADAQVYVAAVVNQNPDGKFYMSECVDSEGNYVRIENSPPNGSKSGVTVQDGVTATPGELSSEQTIAQQGQESNTKKMDVTDWLVEDGKRARAEREGKVYHEPTAAISPDGGQAQRDAGPGAGGQGGGVPGRAAAERGQAAEQSRTAVERQNKAKVLQPGKSSPAELGVQNGSQTASLTVLPAGFDKSLDQLGAFIGQQTGKPVRFVLGGIEVETAEGGRQQVRGVWSSDGLIIQADNLRVKAENIALHELYHDKAARTPGMVREAENRIRAMGAEQFDRVLDAYMRVYGPVYGLTAEMESVPQEIYDAVLEEVLADAYAGINAFGVDATQFAGTVVETAAEYESRRDPLEKIRNVQGPRYSLREFEDGRRFVDVQTDQGRFNGLTDKQKLQEARKVIRGRFAGKVIGLDNPVFVNGNSAKHYAQQFRPVSGEVVDAKARASTELDNVVDAGFNFRSAPDGLDGHTHEDVAGDWEYFDAIFKVGGDYYQGTVNVKNTSRGRLFYDLTHIENVTQDTHASQRDSSPGIFLRDASMDTAQGRSRGVTETGSLAETTSAASEGSIRQDGADVNRKNQRFSADDTRTDEQRRKDELTDRVFGFRRVAALPTETFTVEDAMKAADEFAAKKSAAKKLSQEERERYAAVLRDELGRIDTSSHREELLRDGGYRAVEANEKRVQALKDKLAKVEGPRAEAARQSEKARMRQNAADAGEKTRRAAELQEAGSLQEQINALRDKDRQARILRDGGFEALKADERNIAELERRLARVTGRETDRQKAEYLQETLDKLSSAEFQERLLNESGMEAAELNDRLIEQCSRLKKELELKNKPAVAEKTKKTQTPVAKSKPIIAKGDFRRNVLDLFSIPNEQRERLGAMLDRFSDRALKAGSISEADRKTLLDFMYR